MPVTIVTAPEIIISKPAEDRRYSFDFTGVLAAGDSLTGTPVVTVSPTGPTIGTPTISGSLVLCRISDVTADVDYTFVCQCGTTGGDTLEGNGILLGRSA